MINRNPFSIQAKRNISAALMGHSVSKKARAKMRKAKLKNPTKYWLGKHLSIEHKRKVRKGGKGKHFHTKETLKRILTRRIPSSLEDKFQKLIVKYNLPYEFVGDGSFIIGNYNPDFININHEKIAIEVYATYYKKRSKQSITEWKKQRANTFKQYGWKTLYFDETQVNEEHILSILKKGE